MKLPKEYTVEALREAGVNVNLLIRSKKLYVDDEIVGMEYIREEPAEELVEEPIQLTLDYRE